MFEDLARAIEELDTTVDGAALVQVIGLWERLGARVAAAVGEFDSHKSWNVDGSVSMASWLRSSASMTTRSASRLASMGRQLRQLPELSSAFMSGRLSAGKVDAILGQLTDSTVEVFAEAEAELVPFFEPLTVSGCARAMAAWRSGIEEEPPTEPERSLHLSSTLDDRYVIEGSLDAESGATVATALRLATTDDTDVARSPSTRRADALVDVCQFFLDNQQTRAGGRHRPHLNVVVDIDALEKGGSGRVIDGPALDKTSVSRLLCDSALHRVVVSGRSAILDYGTSTRTIPAPLWSALVIRDESCRFPGCDRPSTWCEGHHVTWVTHGGATELSNLVLLCRRHHHRLHQPGWQAKLLPDATFEVTDSDGIVRATSPPRRDPPW